MVALPKARWWVALPVVMLLATACAGGPSEQEQKQVTRQLQDLASRVGELDQDISTAHDAVHKLEQRVATLEEGIVMLDLDASRVGISRAEFLPNPPAGQVTVQLLAQVENDGLPGQFTFHLAPEGSELFATESVPEGQSVETGPEIKDGIAFVEPGKFYRLQVVYRNPEDREVRFLVRGGVIDPQVALPFVRNRCWCAAIPFSVPPRGTFSRIIDVGVGPDTPSGAKAIVVFPVVPLSQ